MEEVKCSNCRNKILEEVYPKIIVELPNYCDKCKNSQYKKEEFMFCCFTCLIEFTNKHIALHIFALRKND